MAIQVNGKPLQSEEIGKADVKSVLLKDKALYGGGDSDQLGRLHNEQRLKSLNK